MSHWRQEALLFISDNSAAHRIATLRFFALEEEPRSQLDVSYIGTGKVASSMLCQRCCMTPS